MTYHQKIVVLRWSSKAYALYPHMSVYDNMAFRLKNDQKQEIDFRVREAAKILESKNCSRRKPKPYRVVKRQRGRPQGPGQLFRQAAVVLLMDEPLS